MLKNINIIITNNLNNIPEYLFKQVKGVEHNYYNLSYLFHNNPNNIVIRFIHKKRVVGFLWGIINTNLSGNKIFNIVIWSMDKAYQSKKLGFEIKEMLIKYLKGKDVKKIEFITTRPVAFEKYGFQKSKKTMMELEI